MSDPVTAAPVDEGQVHATRPGPGGEATLGGSCAVAPVPAGGPEMRTGCFVAVTAGLAAAGAVVGAVVAVLTVIVLPLEFLQLWRGGVFFLFVAGLGATGGAVFGPIAGWLVMRHVPLWKEIGGTALATLGGAVLGLVLGGPLTCLLFALWGFGLAAVHVYAFMDPGAPRLSDARDASALHPE